MTTCLPQKKWFSRVMFIFASLSWKPKNIRQHFQMSFNYVKIDTAVEVEHRLVLKYITRFSDYTFRFSTGDWVNRVKFKQGHLQKNICFKIKSYM